MGIEEVANRGATAPKGDMAASGGSFWKSLQGILTAAAGLVAAITGLLIGLSQAGIIGRDDKPSPPVVIDQTKAKIDEKVLAPSKSELTTKPASLLGVEREYKVGKMSDGFAWVRSEPTVSSKGLEQLPSGAHVMCTSRAVVDIVSTVNRTWRYCSAHKGYVSARLLLLVDG
ncbi:MAG: hypothetical protein AABY88_13025 [Pseudomonadota bacterium]